ncbi:uncharacterized protein B0I36DRAFT_338499 [Microdochium trichocladiopsis]|uniref:WD40 repeat domain-containing protein n=1 Tax=Microdochium trichocladiopsis TaxID=1682393 RepID=A0A9P9BIE5_9PEZI|nr:uncharacterized protein B0I36DRAFT_338499 [Microdochium trichocladiopsis]KAH7014280.1 hypothetical protein B0I36DRAFT_338499 [Microdochium trichocladiopsis]
MEDKSVRGSVFSPDLQRLVYFGGYRESVHLLALDGMARPQWSADLPAQSEAEVVHSIRRAASGVVAVSFLRDNVSSHLGEAPSRYRFAIVKTWSDVGHMLCTIDLRTDRASELALCPDGTRLAIDSMSGDITIWNAETGSFLFRVALRNSRIIQLCWSDDGQHIAATTSFDSVMLDLDRLDSDSLDFYLNGEGCFRMFNGETGQPLRLWNFSNWTTSPTIAICSNQELVVWSSYPRTKHRLVSAVTGAAVAQDVEYPEAQDIGASPLRGAPTLLFPSSTKQPCFLTASQISTGLTEVKLWNGSAQRLLGQWQIGGDADILAIRADNKCIITDRGCMKLQAPGIQGFDFVTPPETLETKTPSITWDGVGVSLDDSWITCDGERVLWLPTDYAPVAGRTVSGDTTWLRTRDLGLAIITCKTSILRDLMRRRP